MTASEFREWMLYYQMEPFGAWRDNYHSAQLCALLFNINRGNSPSRGPDDFMWMDSQTAQEKRDAEFLAQLTGMAKSGD